MLIDKQGRVVNPCKLPKGKAKREAALAELCEVPYLASGHGKQFTLEQRARLKGARK